MRASPSVRRLVALRVVLTASQHDSANLLARWISRAREGLDTAREKSGAR